MLKSLSKNSMVAFQNLLRCSPTLVRNSSSNGSCLKPTAVEEEYEIKEIYNYLRNFPGGSVDLDLTALDSQKIVKIVINQPKTRNAFSGSMFCDLLDVVQKLEDPEIANKCSGVVILGKKGTFCSGADLNYVRPSLNTAGGWRMTRIMHHTFSRFSALPFLSASLIEGFAVCGGAELTTWTDFRLADPGAKIIFVQARRGLTTAWVGTFRLAQILGPQRALQTLVSSRTLTANMAHEIGFVDVVLSPTKSDTPASNGEKATAAEQAATKWMTELCSNTEPYVVHSYKRTLQELNAQSIGNIQKLMKVERDNFLQVWATPRHIMKFNEQFEVKKT